MLLDNGKRKISLRKQGKVEEAIKRDYYIKHMEKVLENTKVLSVAENMLQIQLNLQK